MHFFIFVAGKSHIWMAGVRADKMQLILDSLKKREVFLSTVDSRWQGRRFRTLGKKNESSVILPDTSAGSGCSEISRMGSLKRHFGDHRSRI